jgi:hypothetical protein
MTVRAERASLGGVTTTEPKGFPVKLTVPRAIPIALAIALATFFLSGVDRFKTAHHGLDYVVGEAVWLGFLLAALALLVLVAVALFRRISQRRATITSACICVLALGVLTGTSAAAGTPTVSVTLGAHGPTISGPTRWHPGPVRIAAVSREADQEVTLLHLRPGYTYAEFVADGKRAQGHGAAARAAVAHVFANTVFDGGINLFRGQSADFTVILKPGTYYIGEMTSRPQLTRIHVRGERSIATSRSTATITATNNSYRVTGELPANGTITVADASGRPHRANLIPVKPGTTRAELGAYIRKTGGNDNAPAPPFALNGPQLGTADLSPGRRMQLAYGLPAGTYALLDFDHDMKTGRPDTLDGMYAIVTLR